MKNNQLNKNFFTIFVMVIIAVANIVSAVLKWMDHEWPSMIFNVVIGVFAGLMAVYFYKNPKTDKR